MVQIHVVEIIPCLRQIPVYPTYSIPHKLMTWWCKEPGPWFNIKMPSYHYRNSHCGDKMILWPSYFHNGISYTGKMTSLYWIRDLVAMVDQGQGHKNIPLHHQGISSYTYTQGTQLLIFYWEWFQLPVPSQCCKKIKNANIFLCFLKHIQCCNG